MAQHTEIYRGFKIMIDDDSTTGATRRSFTESDDAGSVSKILIDDTEVDIEETRPGTFLTNYLPYTRYGSALDLAKAVIDHTEEFVNASTR